MAKAEYSFSIPDDTLNGVVDFTRLEYEIRSSAGILIALDYIESSGDDLDIWFKDTLSSSGEVILGEVVAAHTGDSWIDNDDKSYVVWYDFKVLVEETKMSVFYTEPVGHNSYRVFGVYAGAFFYTIVDKNSTDAVEFENTLKNQANINEAQKVRITNCRVGRKLHNRYITFTTADGTIDSFDNTDYKNEEYGDVTYIMKDVDGITTVDGSKAKETWIDWEPPLNFEVAGGALDVPSVLGEREIDTSGITQSSGVATVAATVMHNLVEGSVVTIVGVDQSEYNGAKRVINILDSYRFQIEVRAGTESPATGDYTVKEGEDAWEIHVVGAPDIPPSMGGTINFIANPRLKWKKGKSLEMDSSLNPAEITYDPVYHSGKIRFIVKHPVGVKAEFQLDLNSFI